MGSDLPSWCPPLAAGRNLTSRLRAGTLDWLSILPRRPGAEPGHGPAPPRARSASRWSARPSSSSASCAAAGKHQPRGDLVGQAVDREIQIALDAVVVLAWSSDLLPQGATCSRRRAPPLHQQPFPTAEPSWWGHLERTADPSVRRAMFVPGVESFYYLCTKRSTPQHRTTEEDPE